MNEIWKDIPGYEGLYQVSKTGKIKSLSRPLNSLYGPRTVKEKIMQDHDNGKGYRYISLSINNIKKNYYIHNLVAGAFLGERPEGCEVNHKDCNKCNNDINNLEYITRSDNMKHAAENGRFKNRNVGRGERHGCSKFTNKDIILIRKLFNEYGMRIKTIVWLFDMDQGTVWGIANNRSWKHLSNKECFSDGGNDLRESA